MNNLKWVHADEWYTWFPCEAKEANMICHEKSGETFAEVFEDQYKQIPTALVDKLESALQQYLKAVNAIDEWIKANKKA